MKTGLTTGAVLVALLAMHMPLPAHGQRIHCWGANSDGELGNNSTTSSNVPVVVAGNSSFVAVAAGTNFTCAIASTGRAYCWGAGEEGQVGNGQGVTEYTPQATWSTPFMVQIAAGSVPPFACGLESPKSKASDSVECWGNGTFGALGTLEANFSLYALPVESDIPFRQIATGGGFACAIDVENVTWCWGWGKDGRLGTGFCDLTSTAELECSNEPLPTPVASDVNFSSISTGDSHACALDFDGTAYCWGDNSYGQLGTNSTNTSTIPVEVVGNHTFSQISAGGKHTCGLLKATGAALCWGGNEAGQLGTGATAGSLFPAPVSGGVEYAYISAGAAHTCVLGPKGGAACWGANSNGQLGDNTTVPYSAVPRLVVGDWKYKQISAGATHTCAVVASTAGATFSAVLNGSNQNPVINTPASGNITVKYDESAGSMSWTLSLSDITNFTMAHIHAGGPSEVAGPVAVLLVPPPSAAANLPPGSLPMLDPPFTGSKDFTGTINASDLTGPLMGKTLGDLVTLIQNNQAYVNGHTVAHPAGEIRGQLQAA